MVRPALVDKQRIRRQSQGSDEGLIMNVTRPSKWNCDIAMTYQKVVIVDDGLCARCEHQWCQEMEALISSVGRCTAFENFKNFKSVTGWVRFSHLLLKALESILFKRILSLKIMIVPCGEPGRRPWESCFESTCSSRTRHISANIVEMQNLQRCHEGVHLFGIATVIV